MGFMVFFNRYLEANALIVAGFFAVSALQSISERGSAQIRYSHLLFIARSLLASTLVISCFQLPFSTKSFLSPSAQIWTAPTMRARNTSEPHNVVTLGSSAARAEISIESLGSALLLFLVGWGLVFVWRFGPASRMLRQIHRNASRLKRIGRLEVLVSDEISIPFSFWFPGRALVFLPSQLVENIGHFMIAFRHEVQHHRQRDTIWVYALELFRLAFILNPFAHLMVKRISQIQEFACDEALVDRKHVSPHAYGGCLLKVAETARGDFRVLVGTTCMAAVTEGSFLKRRITIMLNEKKRYLNRSVSIAGGILSLAVVVSAAWGSQGVVQDRRMTIQDANRLADVARKNSVFPITINESVLKELNRYVGTPDGREFIKNTLMRMENYRTLVENKLRDYQLPHELMALPIMESGYQNIMQNHNPYSAGVWQFVPQTGRNFGLTVDEETDERLNVEKETDAACRFLGALNLRFQNWELSVLAYNAGEGKIQQGIDDTGSRNAWVLVNNGFEGDEGYLSKMMASVLILNSPSILE